jgi:hypothetical protein
MKKEGYDGERGLLIALAHVKIIDKKQGCPMKGSPVFI